MQWMNYAIYKQQIKNKEVNRRQRKYLLSCQTESIQNVVFYFDDWLPRQQLKDLPIGLSFIEFWCHDDVPILAIHILTLAGMKTGSCAYRDPGLGWKKDRGQ